MTQESKPLSIADPGRLLNDDETLDHTRAIRQVLLHECIKDGMPEQNKDKRLVMELLSQIDESTLTRKKLASDDANADKNLEAARLVATMRKSLGDRNIYEIPSEKVVSAPKADLDRLPNVTLNEGEMSTEVSTETYSEFIAKHAPDEE